MSPSPPRQDALSLMAYRAAAGLLSPIAHYTLQKRLEAGKEDPARISERRGIAGRARPAGDIIWIHGASVGESLSILSLLEALITRYPHVHFLITTGTLTSATLMAERLPEQAFHQYAPLDHPDFVSSFLDHWTPQACIFVESELWPNLVTQTYDRHIPLALVNGRMSPKSFKNWKKRQKAARALLSCFSVIIAQNTENAERLSNLRGQLVNTHGNLKMTAAPLPAQEDTLKALHLEIGDRPVWLASSTHIGEDELVLTADSIIREKFPDLLTIIAPRHPARGSEIKSLTETAKIKSISRSSGQPIDEHVQIYIADSLGELGLFYRISNISFIGGSLIEIGGHNPLESARLGATIIHGPHTFNFSDTYEKMRQSGASALVRNERDLGAAIARLLADPFTQKSMAKRAENWAISNSENVLSKIVKDLEPVFEPLNRDAL